jgi:hypothetical protein
MTTKISMQEFQTSNNFITTPFGEEVLYEVNRDAFDRVGSDALFRQRFGNLLKREDTLHVIVGTDSGLLPRWLVERGLPTGSRFLFIELPVLADTIAGRLDGLLPDQVAIARPDQLQEYAETFQFQDYAYIEQLEFVESFGAMDANLAEYRDVAYAIEQEVVNFKRTIQLQLGNHVFLRRQIENLADNLVPTQPLRDCFKGRDAVLLGGGPSLDDMLAWINDHRDQLLLIAVSRIARQLLAKGITVDVVVSVDPHPVSYDVSKEMLRLNRDTLFLNAFHVTPLILGQWHGDAVYAGPKYPWKSKLDTDNMENVGPTVTNTALNFALFAGCARVILAGVDLCYDRAGITHASGSIEQQAGPLLDNTGVQLETNGGWLADTNPPFAQAARTLEIQARTAAQRDCAIINPAPGAAKIPGIDHVPLADIDTTADERSAREAIQRSLPQQDAAFRRKTLAETARELARVNGRLRSMRKLAEEALEFNVKLFGRHGGKADFKFKKRMDKVERRLDRDYKDLMPLVKNFGAKSFLRLSRPNNEREWSDDEIEQWGRRYYEIYAETVTTLLELIEAAQDRIKSRLDELSDSPDFDSLFHRWEQDSNFGRALLWEERHAMAHAELEPAISQRLDDFKQRFEDSLQDQDTPLARRCREERSLKPVRGKLLQLFQHGNTEELQRHADILGQDASDEAVELHALAIGYLRELQEDGAGALDAYNRILELAADSLEDIGKRAHNPRLEDALRRMSFITLHEGDGDSALQVLDVLSALSPVYEPQYAELLRLTGRVDDAIGVYTDYLQRAPNDLGTMLKLGKLFQDSGALESAQLAYDYILNKDPDNNTARQLQSALHVQEPS